MATNTHTGQWARRLGRSAGRAWRGLARRDRQTQTWLMRQGLPAGVAEIVLWVIKLVVLGILLYAAFWLVSLLLFAIAVAWVARNADASENDDEPEWRDGLLGFGLYDSKGFRIDPHDPDE